jgi:hypothetical protein
LLGGRKVAMSKVGRPKAVFRAPDT